MRAYSKMRELIDPNAVEKGLLFVAVAGPLVGLIFGIVLGAHERCAWPRILAGALIGGLGTAVYAMWHVYGAVPDALGLDTVLNLCVQLALFAVFGAVLGLLIFQVRQLIRKQLDRR